MELTRAYRFRIYPDATIYEAVFVLVIPLMSIVPARFELACVGPKPTILGR